MLKHVNDFLDALLLLIAAGTSLRTHWYVASILELLSEVCISSCRTELVNDVREIILSTVLLVGCVVCTCICPLTAEVLHALRQISSLVDPVVQILHYCHKVLGLTVRVLICVK